MTTDGNDLSYLFEGKNLWQIYRKSPSLFQTTANSAIFVIAAVSLGAFAAFNFMQMIATATFKSHLDFNALFGTWASAGLAFATTILGFLLAGFSVLFAVLKPETMAWLRKVTRTESKLDELKLMFVSFVGVFCHYIAFTFLCVVYTVMGGPGSMLETVGAELTKFNPVIPVALTHGFFVVWGVWFVVLVLKLKSFIYNLYESLLLLMADSLT